MAVFDRNCSLVRVDGGGVGGVVVVVVVVVGLVHVVFAFARMTHGCRH